MKFALCNEVIREMPFPAQCEFAAALGYDGLEVAPFTLSERPHETGAIDAAATRRAARDAGIEIVSLHWLLVAPEGLSITDPDDNVRARTIDVMRRLIDLCGELGGTALVHGSPLQRRLTAGDEDGTRDRATACFAAVADTAKAAGVLYCIEALAPQDAEFINRVSEAAAMVDVIGSPHVRTMLDCCATARLDEETPADLIDRWLPSGHMAHVQVNDGNGQGPGQGDLDFKPILAALQRHGYAGTVAVEPFDYVPDGPAAAARAIGYLRGIEEALRV
ncbi:MAG: sugar phosphate isomerase/epimerase [Rhodospirillaceae bacterium]|nr:sugar phosphate isomerase/epimerase [Rhodospirillaceae bacterium]MBT5193797.1 sugar phosphate isomerase/epimerase [Rhodospirillaceae bacterium]MBT5897194.1 sugar phosphate isomerase/epimerase [Rhodospirillaceae bacterium]MBT6427559.1 sugar phosphate isomerase/epimerase [Rhodospirillaceae bacterium]MBT7758627.1 sugar phosphate isomerase/epimerase [Rhodospirillaceae bacterium]